MAIHVKTAGTSTWTVMKMVMAKEVVEITQTLPLSTRYRTGFRIRESRTPILRRWMKTVGRRRHRRRNRHRMDSWTEVWGKRKPKKRSRTPWNTVCAFFTDLHVGLLLAYYLEQFGSAWDENSLCIFASNNNFGSLWYVSKIGERVRLFKLTMRHMKNFWTTKNHQREIQLSYLNCRRQVTLFIRNFRVFYI